MLVEEIGKLEQHLKVIIKVIVPAIIGVVIKLGVEMKKNGGKISFLNASSSFCMGIGVVWLCRDLVQNTFPEDIIPIVFAFLAIIVDKLAEFLIYEFKVDTFVINLIQNLFKRKD